MPFYALSEKSEMVVGKLNNIKENDMEFNLQEQIGKPKNTVIEYLKERNFQVNIKSEDGEGGFSLPVVRMNRVNLTISNGIVTEIKMG